MNPLPSRFRRPALLPLLLAPALLCAGASPAGDLYTAAGKLLVQHYFGWATQDRRALVAEYQARLDAACAPTGDACSYDTGRAVVKAMLAELHDDHTNIRDREGAERLREVEQDLTVQRTGARVVKTPQGLLVVDVQAGSPAAGVLRRSDLIVRVNGQEAGTDRAVDAAAFVTLERRGEPLNLSVQRAGSSAPLSLSVTTAPLKARDEPTLTLSGDTAVITYPSFLAGDSAERFLARLKEAQQAGARSLVVDLRYNGGGRLDQCVAAASAFGPVLYRATWADNSWEYGGLKGQAASPRSVRAALDGPLNTQPRLWSGPAVMLVGPNTASCAEVFSLYAQRAGAQVVGETTKGVTNSGVNFFPLPDGGALSVTQLRASGADGQPLPQFVQPDVAAPTDVAALVGSGQDTALAAALRAARVSAVR